MMLQAVAETWDYKIPENWQNRGVKTIVTVGKYLSMQRDKLSSEEFKKLATVDLGLSRDSAYKLISIANHPILSDPAHERKLPPSWALLYELRAIPPAILGAKLATGRDFKNVTKYDIWAMRGVERKKPAPKMALVTEKRKYTILSNRRWIKTPEGTSLIDLCRLGMSNEAVNHVPPEKAAKGIGIGVQSYRIVKSVILLAEREDLNDGDSQIVRDVLEQIDKTGRVKEHYSRIEPIINKIWGTARQGRTYEKKTEKRRLESFQHAIDVTCVACQKGSQMEIPHLSKTDRANALIDLVEAKESLTELINKIRSEQ